MKSLLVIVTGLGTTWHYTDLTSDAPLASVISPLFLLIFLIALAIWLVMFFYNSGINQTTPYSGDTTGFGDIGDGGGDS